jgi:hypothetical protein
MRSFNEIPPHPGMLTKFANEAWSWRQLRSARPKFSMEGIQSSGAPSVHSFPQGALAVLRIGISQLARKKADKRIKGRAERTRVPLHRSDITILEIRTLSSDPQRRFRLDWFSGVYCTSWKVNRSLRRRNTTTEKLKFL